MIERALTARKEQMLELVELELKAVASRRNPRAAVSKTYL